MNLYNFWINHSLNVSWSWEGSVVWPSKVPVGYFISLLRQVGGTCFRWPWVPCLECGALSLFFRTLGWWICHWSSHSNMSCQKMNSSASLTTDTSSFRFLFCLLFLPNKIMRCSISIRLFSTAWLCILSFQDFNDQKACSDIISKGYGAISPHNRHFPCFYKANHWQHRWVEWPQFGIYGTFFALPNVGCKVAWEGLALLSTWVADGCFLRRCQGEKKTQQPLWAKDVESPSPGYLIELKPEIKAGGINT